MHLLSITKKLRKKINGIKTTQNTVYVDLEPYDAILWYVLWIFRNRWLFLF